jgi:hypothetical protein
VVEKRQAAAVSAEVDWGEYFHSIRKACPWSLAAWNKGLISITKWRRQVIDLEPYSARLYIVDLNPRRLKKLCQQLDQDLKYEWLWSHPRYSTNSTPLPVLIQQDRAELNAIRDRLRSVD